MPSLWHPLPRAPQSKDGSDDSDDDDSDLDLAEFELDDEDGAGVQSGGEGRAEGLGTLCCVHSGPWTDFFNTRMRRAAQKKFPFLPGANLGGLGLLTNGGKRMFKIMGPAGVFPVIYPNSAKMALGWPIGLSGGCSGPSSGVWTAVHGQHQMSEAHR